jgi:1-pyrroline-4-hydroxy-2-carboxylate deaminase
MSIQWKGVFPAITTQFTANDTLDLDKFALSLEAQADAGIDGVILGGSLGEASTLTNAEKETLVKFSLDKVGSKMPVMLNIAEGSTRDAVKQAELGKSWGVNGLMLLPPMRYKSDHRETVEYFKAVADSTDLPIMIYNNPVDYKIDVTPDIFDELQECENIQAIKESSRDTTNVIRLVNRFGDRYKVFGGVDTLAMETILMGAVGWVGGLVNAFPRETVAIYRLTKAGRTEEALAIYRWFMPLLELDIHPKLVQYIKLAAAQAGLGSEHVRAPRLRLVGEERERVLKIIDDGIAVRPELPDYLSIADNKASVFARD